MIKYIYNQMIYITIMFDFTWRLSDCEGLVRSPDRRDYDHVMTLQAEMRLTTLCIDAQGGVYWGAIVRTYGML